jgi:hypothetical protein
VIRNLLLRVPILGPYVERRWMPDPVERDRHQEIVRGRLEAPVIADVPADQAETPQLSGGAPED